MRTKIQNYNLLQEKKQKQKQNHYNISITEIKNITYQILLGLNHLHHIGIIHRNLKPDNILIFETKINNNFKKVIQLSDFALSKQISVPHGKYTPEVPKDREQSNRECKRLWYKSPELFLRKSQYGFAVDIWAFGCILAELTSGCPLFYSNSEIEQLFSIFKVIGSPNKENFMGVSDLLTFDNFYFPNWEYIPLSYISYPQQSEQFQLFFRKKHKYLGEFSYNQLFQIGQILGVDGMDLLDKCLQLIPCKRLTIEQALKHPFFQQLHNTNYECSKIVIQQVENYSNLKQINIPQCNIYSLLNYYYQQEKSKDLQLKIKFKQSNVDEQMIILTIDWLFNVSLHFGFQSNTIHYAVYYLHQYIRYMGKIQLERDNLQLTAASCLLLSEIMNEISKEHYKLDNAKYYSLVTNEQFTREQIVEMEKNIANTLNYNLNGQSVLSFLDLYNYLLFQSNSQFIYEEYQITEQVIYLVIGIIKLFKFLADLTLLDNSFLKYELSMLSFSIMFLAMKEYQKNLNKLQIEILHQNTNLLKYDIKEFEQCLLNIQVQWQKIKQGNFQTNFDPIFNKYLIKNSIGFRTNQIIQFTLNEFKEFYQIL